MINSLEAAGAAATVIGELWQGWKPAADQGSYEPGNIGGDDRYDPVTRQLLYEQLSKAGVRQLQRRDRSAQFTVERGSARPAADPKGLAAVAAARAPVDPLWPSHFL